MGVEIIIVDDDDVGYNNTIGFDILLKPQKEKISKANWEDAPNTMKKRKCVGEGNFIVETIGPTKGYIRATYIRVLPQFRNRGFAEQIYQYALVKAKMMGFKGIASNPAMRISKECDSLWNKLRTRKIKGHDVFETLDKKGKK